MLEFETHDSKNPEGRRGERKKTQRKGNRDESWGSSRELNTSLSTLVSNDVDLAFSSRHCLVFHRWIHDEAKGGGREAESEAGFEWNSLMFSHRVEKKSMRSRYRCVLSGRRFTLIPQTGRNQYDGEYEPFQPQNDPSSQIPTSFDHPLYVSFPRILRIYRGVSEKILSPLISSFLDNLMNEFRVTFDSRFVLIKERNELRFDPRFNLICKYVSREK